MGCVPGLLLKWLFLRGIVLAAFSRMGFYRTRKRARMAKSSKTLETFPNPKPERDFVIHMQIPEFTCLCPKTSQPDFATLFLDYIPDRTCVELKSLKLYIWSFRDEGKFHEAVTNEILDDLVAATSPRFMRLTARFFVRGGIFTSVVAEHRQAGWTPLQPVDVGAFPLESNIR
jgi:7-cyano-7-deazaguanine reductase